jgi:hypothetical protein
MWPMVHGILHLKNALYMEVLYVPYGPWSLLLPKVCALYGVEALPYIVH